MARSMAKEVKALQQENAWLKKLVANQALDIEILREAAERKLTVGEVRRRFGARSSFAAPSLSKH